jgi:hypothetical protein
MPPRLLRIMKTLFASFLVSIPASLGLATLWDWLILQAYGDGMGPHEALGYLLPWPDLLQTALGWWPLIFGIFLGLMWLGEALFGSLMRRFWGLMMVFSLYAIIGYLVLEAALGVRIGLENKAHYDLVSISGRAPLFITSFFITSWVLGLIYGLIRWPWGDKREA